MSSIVELCLLCDYFFNQSFQSRFSFSLTRKLEQESCKDRSLNGSNNFQFEMSSYRKGVQFILALTCVINIGALNLDCSSTAEDQTCFVEGIEISKENEVITELNDNVSVFKKLIISNGTVNYLPTNLGDKFPHLSSLSVRRSKLLEVSKNNFAGTNITALDLFNNELKRIDRDTFDGLVFLEDLSLSDNEIKFVHERAFTSLINLRDLNLDANYLSELPLNLFKNNRRVTRISLKDNYLKTLPTFIFNNLRQLQVLELDSNEFTGLQDRLLQNNGKIEKLTVSNNFIAHVGQETAGKIEKIAEKNFLYNPCLEKLTAKSTDEELMEILKKNCAADDEIRVKWLDEGMEEMVRYRREAEQEFECNEKRSLKTEEDLNSLKALMSTGKPNEPLSSIEPKTDDEYKGKIDKLATDLDKIKNILYEKIKRNFSVTSEKIREVNETIAKVAENVTKALEPKIDAIPERVKSLLIAENDSMKKSIIDAFNARRCDFFEITLEFTKGEGFGKLTASEKDSFVETIKKLQKALHQGDQTFDQLPKTEGAEDEVRAFEKDVTEKCGIKFNDKTENLDY